MTTHAAALCEEIAPEIQRLRSLRDAIARVTLLTTRLSVLFLKHGPQPKMIPAVSFFFSSRRATVAPVTTRTTKLLGIMKLKNLFVGMTHKRTRERVFLSVRVLHARLRDLQRLADTRVTGRAASGGV